MTGTATAMVTARRFTWDKGKAREWLDRAVAVFEDWVEGAGYQPASGEPLPGISDDWSPAGLDDEDDVCDLVTYAVSTGIIAVPAVPPFPGQPEGDLANQWSLDFEYACGEYWFAVGAGLGLSLVTSSLELHKLGERDARGAAAGMAILQEAVASGNRALDALDSYVAGQQLAAGQGMQAAGQHEEGTA